MKDHHAIAYTALPDYDPAAQIARARAFYAALKTRRTCRHFSDEPVPREVIEKIMNYMEKKYISIPMKMAREVLLNETVKN